jgi:hypothetical protein
MKSYALPVAIVVQQQLQVFAALRRSPKRDNLLHHPRNRLETGIILVVL